MTISNSTQDPLKIQRGLITLFLVAASVFLAWFGLSKGMPLIGLLIPVIAFICWLFGSPERLLIGVLFAESAQLVIPGITKTMGVPELFQGLVIGWAILGVALRHKKQGGMAKSPSDKWLLILTLDILLIMFVRGSGFAMLGSSTYGGTGYLILFLAIGFYFSAIQIPFRSRYVKTLLWMMFFGSLIPGFTEILVNHTGGGFQWLSSVVNTNVEQVMAEEVTEGGVQRWSSVASIGSMLIPLAFILCKNKGIRFGLMLAALVLIALSGFRGRTSGAMIVIFCITVYDSKNRTRTVVLWLVAGLAALAFLMVAAPYLPRAIQRAVSFIQFIPVDPVIAERAGHSSTWRFDLWRNYCIPNVPHYLLIGRGIAHDITQFAWLQSSWYGSADFFYYMGRYHSGPFSLLLDFGLLGTISFTLFFWFVMVDGWKTVRRFKSSGCDPLVFRYYVYLSILFTYYFFSFYLIFGDVRASLPKLLLTVVQMKLLQKIFLTEAVPAPEEVPPEIGGRHGNP